MPWQVIAVPNTVVGASQIYVQSAAPTGTIPLNSLWFNTTPGNESLNTWNGTTWVQIAVPANNLIEAGTIIATLVAAGIVISGIVNGTTIIGALIETSAGVPQVQLDSARNALFIYDAAGNLQAALAGLAGTDFFGHTYPAGLFCQQLTLNNQSSAPPSFVGGSVFYSSGAGRPRYVSSAGVDNSIQRADVNMTTFTVGNTNVQSVISSAINYRANEGTVSSEYEIEIDGIITTATAGASNTLTFGLAVDGALLGAQFTIGGVFLVVTNTFEYSIRFRLSINTDGAGGTATLTADGQVSKQGFNAGSSSSPLVDTSVGAMSGATPKPFDTTIAHTLQAFAAWGATNAGQQIQTFRTRVTRRD